jgi:hypothetical protein
LGAPPGWKSVRRANDEKGISMSRHSVVSSTKRWNQRSALSPVALGLRLSNRSTWTVPPRPSPAYQKRRPA